MRLEENRIGLIEKQIGLLKSELCRENRKKHNAASCGSDGEAAIKHAVSVSVRLALRS